jgi:hypothetical protein
LAIAKHQAGDGTWHDIVPIRPTTKAPGFDSAGPAILSGNSVVGVPVGDHLETSSGSVQVLGGIRSRSGSNLETLRARYLATSCGVELLFAAYPGHAYEYSAFFRGTRSPKRDGGKLTGRGPSDQTVTADPAPYKVHIQKDYGSANDPRLVRARMRFQVANKRTVHVEMC